ncbi:hypothetical protein AMTRI_Chr05g63390 [Amborella trichopoda]|uniref:Glycosyltransferase family 14 protein n=1 Tax=Amborella trichopoda TaxID=13333 RepID=W1NXH6_AMBTC|nr:beta-glucuronosyltransferase GlcAT14A [Amborella trichopoda]ERN00353.1 hypothetical protein AMTR_s00104p00076850 [Amborella trichopoda]|eukprot:XP_006837784.1 beta-glucuronosyltransferase GlcAT14A [Amborella trichopoda]
MSSFFSSPESRFPKPEKKWVFPLAITLSFSLILLFFTTFIVSYASIFRISSISTNSEPLFVESKLGISPPVSSVSTIPRLGYLISGSVGDVESLKRTLQALYHPLNQYVVHLDLASSVDERLELANYVENHPIFSRIANVHVVTKANLVTYRGPTMVANTLHAASILLKKSGEWDWFINLSSSDYPLVTQDDLLLTLTGLPRHLNFIEHTSDIGWKEFQRAKPIIIDPGLYMLQKSEVFWVSQRRSVPTAFKLFTGSAWMMLSRAFIEFCVWGWDNLPRTVLMYYSNFLSSPEGYFHTVICNAEEFTNTTVNHDLHYISWDNPPKQHPHFLVLNDFSSMVQSNAPFARKFGANDPVLDKIDQELLDRGAGHLVPGGWCIGDKKNGSDPCSVIGKTGVLTPGKGAVRLKSLIDMLLSRDNFHPSQCK